LGEIGEAFDARDDHERFIAECADAENFLMFAAHNHKEKP
jgi:hypothetical protein